MLSDVWHHSVGDVDVGAVDMGPLLDDGELIASVSVTEASLTISNVAVSTSTLSIKGRSVPAGEAIQFKYSGMQANVWYDVAIQVVTDSTPARTRNYCQRIITAPDC